MTPFKRRVIQDFNRAAVHYDRFSALQREVAETLFAMAREGIAPGMEVLDLGAGTGYFAELANRHHCHWQIAALDISSVMCHQSEITAVCADMESMPFKDQAFGAIFSSLALQWAEHLDTCLAEMQRVLCEGGRAYFSLFTGGTLQELNEAFKGAGLIPSVHVFPSADQVKHALAAYSRCDMRTVSMKRHYQDFLALAQAIKGVGGSFKTTGSRMSQALISRVADAYHKNFREAEGIYATWNILYVEARK